MAELLYREAARHCLCILFECDAPVEVERALATLSAQEVAERTGGPEMAMFIRQLFRGGALQDAPVIHGTGHDALPIKSVADVLIHQGTRQCQEHSRLLFAVTLRWLLMTTVLLTLLGAVVVFSPLRRSLWDADNLIAGASWRASSAESATYADKGSLQDLAHQPFFFHTKLEDSPWIEIEIPGPLHKVSKVTVDNRTDCCGARALPLAVELSNDRVTWKVVAQRSVPFQHWSAHFELQSARWIRLRVLRTSYLHLSSVAAY